MAEEILEHSRSDDDARVGPRLTRSTTELHIISKQLHESSKEARSPTLAGNDGTGDEPPRWMAVETVERRKPYGGRTRD